jgi:hypothetical protein
MSHDEHDEALDAAYRRASDADAGRPAAATRAAILARASEQARASRRQAPAANDRHVIWRAAAGVAVLGFALLLWRQSEPPRPARDAPVFVPEAPAEVSSAETAAPAPAPPPAVAAPDDDGAAALRDRSEADVARSARRLAAPAPAPTPAPAPAPALGAASVAAAAPESAMARESAPASPAAALLREHFPGLDQRDAPASVWLVLDAGGAVLRQGERQAGQSLEALAEELAAGPDGLRVATWRTETVTNGAGQPVEVAVAGTRP